MIADSHHCRHGAFLVGGACVPCAVEAEREANAQLCERYALRLDSVDRIPLETVAKKIRARGHADSHEDPTSYEVVEGSVLIGPPKRDPDDCDCASCMIERVGIGMPGSRR